MNNDDFIDLINLTRKRINIQLGLLDVSPPGTARWRTAIKLLREDLQEAVAACDEVQSKYMEGKNV
jgi:hypothetical protein